jgi:dihydrofolate reductase
MSKIIFDSGISLDGFFAGDNRSPKNPMGGVSGQIHSLMFNQKAFWEYLGFEGGKEDSADGKYIRETIARTGAFIMGKRMFEEGEASWPNDLYKADVYVLTHEKREPWVQEGTTTFYFINDGIESALNKAKQSAKGKDIRIQGGANTGFASGGVTCKLGALCFYSSSVLVDSFVLRNPPERKARKRWDRAPLRKPSHVSYTNVETL